MQMVAPGEKLNQYANRWYQVDCQDHSSARQYSKILLHEDKLGEPLRVHQKYMRAPDDAQDLSSGSEKRWPDVQSVTDKLDHMLPAQAAP